MCNAGPRPFGGPPTTEAFDAPLSFAPAPLPANELLRPVNIVLGGGGMDQTYVWLCLHASSNANCTKLMDGFHETRPFGGGGGGGGRQCKV